LCNFPYHPSFVPYIFLWEKGIKDMQERNGTIIKDDRGLGMIQILFADYTTQILFSDYTIQILFEE
jgi:hypothetical protein